MTKQIVISGKAGKLHAPYIRDLRGVMDREQAEMGVLVDTSPTRQARHEPRERPQGRRPGATGAKPAPFILPEAVTPA
jgi:hypothetical protein